MKKIVTIMLLVLLLFVAAVAQAQEVAPGDEITVSFAVTANPNKSAMAMVGLSVDWNVFEFVSATGANGSQPPEGPNVDFGVYALTENGIPVGSIGSVVLRVKDDAPAGTYTISAYVRVEGTIDEQPSTGLVIGGGASITVKSEPPITVPPVTDPPVTVPPITEPPVTVPPITEPPVTVPPITEPPVTVPPITEPPVTVPPITEPPVTEPPITEPPVTVPPVTVPPITEPPTAPPVTVPPVTVPPVTEPPVAHYRMTVHSFGPRFRDVSDVTKDCERFTAIDLSKDGTQTFPLIAGDTQTIGNVKVTVKNGTVTVNYRLASHDIVLESEFLTLLPDLASIDTLDNAKLTSYAFGQPISIADDLNGDTNVLLYMQLHVNYRSDARGIEEFWPNTAANKAAMKAMQDMMD